jgi:hypothetical protein
VIELLSLLFASGFLSGTFEYILDLFMTWLSIFGAPFLETEMLWTIIPIYLSWIFTDLFQEKKHTSFGNAISNGVVVLWVGVDWIRYIVRMMNEAVLSVSVETVAKFILAGATSLYGAIIIIFGIQARDFIHRYGRIRVTSYLLIMFSPLVYGVIPLSFEYVLAIFIFFPLFYVVVSLLAKIIPDSKAVLDTNRVDSGEGIDLLTTKPERDDGISLENDLNSFPDDVKQQSQPMRQQKRPMQTHRPMNGGIQQRPPRQPYPPQYNQQRRTYPGYQYDEEHPFKILK